MTHILKLASVSLFAISLAACASSYSNDSSMNDSMASDSMMKTDLPMVGGAAMYPNKTIVENASQAENLTTLVSLVKMAGLVETLSSPGPFTVFAPVNSAFDKLPSETTAMLTKPENKDALANVLKAHVISGTITSSDLMGMFNGKTSFTAQTVSGDTLTFHKMGKKIKVADENGTFANILIADVMQSNGVVHGIDSVLVPK